MIAALSHDQHINLAQFTKNGTHLFTASDDGTTKMWRSSDGGAVGQPFETSDGSAVQDIAISPDEKLLAAVTNNGQVILWRLSDQQLLWARKQTSKELLTVDFSPDGLEILTAGDDGKARLWQTKDGKHQFTLDGHTDQGVYAKYGPKGKYILTTTGTEVLVWDRSDMFSGAFRMEGHTEQILKAMISPSADMLLTMSLDKTARLWPIISPKDIPGLISEAAKYCRN